MPYLQWKNKRAYAVYSNQINGVRKPKWVALGRFERKQDGFIKYAKHIQIHDSGRQNKEILFSEFLPAYLEHVRSTKADTTYRHQKNHSNVLNREFGNLKVSQIEAKAIGDLCAKNKTKWNDITKRNKLVLLKYVFQYAKARGFKLPENDPFEVIKIPTIQLYKMKPRISQTHIIKSVIGALEPQFKRIAIIQYGTGLRPSELPRIEPGWFDQKNEILDVTRLKTGGNVSYIPLTKEVVKELKKGLPLDFSYQLYARALHKACKAVGHPGAVTPIVFRHQFGSDLANMDPPPPGGLKAIMEMMGHSNIQMTARYVKATDKSKKEAIKRLSKTRALAMG